ncbi:TIGR03086 family metal-binding protein [Actinokineospora bangkokensis]|nr:TIGR03086 family metal-binding protein [Actinokineospora bangkokensis]
MASAREVADRAAHRLHDWDAPTPCSDWDARELLNHLTAEQLWVPHLLAGETVEQVGDRYDDDVLGDDPVATWERANAAAAEAWAGVPDDRVVHLSFGDTPAAEYRWQMTMDLAVHGWDMATAAGADAGIPDELATAVLDHIADDVENWRGTIFADAVDVPSGASPQDRLVALTGRDPGWKPPTRA